jgi:hypothetical protein
MILPETSNAIPGALDGDLSMSSWGDVQQAAGRRRLAEIA